MRLDAGGICRLRQAMRVSDFDFDLPASAIALRPASPRETARLLLLSTDGQIEDRRIGDLTGLLQAGDVLIVNDTRVLPVQLSGMRERDGATAVFEATLIKMLGPTDWQAFIKPGRRVRPGDTLRFGDNILTCDVKAKSEDGIFELAFHQAADEMMSGLQAVGAMPLPPYIRSLRCEDQQDFSDYQTIFANEAGSVAAPTAGLHFTDALLEALRQKGVQIERVTLHVGAGTFLPVKAEDTKDHVMHAEYGEVTAQTAERLNRARREGRRLISVGTTSLRLLESACDSQRLFRSFAAETAIFITPGVEVRSSDALLTNFHLPKSTLFMLVCAFSGAEAMKAAYQHAIDTGYRFFSYGDACLLPNLSGK